MPIFRCENKSCSNYNKDVNLEDTLHWDTALEDFIVGRCKECKSVLKPKVKKNVNLNSVFTINKSASKQLDSHKNTIY